MLVDILLNELRAHLEFLGPQLRSSILVVFCKLGLAASDSASIEMENGFGPGAFAGRVFGNVWLQVR